jgi:parallel beta-helix repeat protein
MLYLSSNNQLYYNEIRNNESGLFLSSSGDNTIYNNNFITNTTQVGVLGATSGNFYNLSAEEGAGNYWSDWTTPDTDGDGFVDYPYELPGGQDYLPWTTPNGWLTQDPNDLLVDLATDVFSLNLVHGIENSLDAKLNTALGALEDVNENNDVAAINALEAFINAVQAQSGKKIIPESAADALIAQAQEIIAILSGV